jgi:hypothetical protein
VALAVQELALTHLGVQQLAQDKMLAALIIMQVAAEVDILLLAVMVAVALVVQAMCLILLLMV